MIQQLKREIKFIKKQDRRLTKYICKMYNLADIHTYNQSIKLNIFIFQFKGFYILKLYL